MKNPTESGGIVPLAAIQLIKVADIVPDPKNQKRSEGIDVLAASIKRDGLLQPIVVRKNTDAKAKAPWMIVAGERRWDAHRLLKADTIECRVRPETLQDAALDSVRKRHAENFHRADLSPVQKARALQELFDLKMPQAEIAAFVGAKDQSTVSNFCRMLRLPEPVLQMVHAGQLTTAHAKALLRWERWPKVCEFIARAAVDEEMTSKQLEDYQLPFEHKLERAKLVHPFLTWDYNADHLDVTKDMKADPDYVICHHTSYCFDAAKLAKERLRQAPIIEERKKKRAQQERASVSSSGGRSLTASEKKTRLKKLADNKRNREETSAGLQSALTKIKEEKGMMPGAALVLAREVMAFRYNKFVEPAAKTLGISLPKGAKMTYGAWNVDKLVELGAEKIVKLMATVLVMRAAHDATRNSWSIPKQITLIVGKKGGAKK